MIFSKSEIEELMNSYSGRVIISGVNGLGQRFVTFGRIPRRLMNGQSPITFPDEISVEMGWENGNLNSRQKSREEFMAVFHTDTKERLNPLKSLYVLKIEDEITGVLYQNADEEQIVGELKKLGEERKKFLETLGRDIEECDLDPVTRKLRDFVGRPIILDNQKGVLVCIDGINDDGNARAIIATPGMLVTKFVTSNSVLATISTSGTRAIIAENEPEKVAPIIRKRANKIKASTQDL